MKLTGVLIIFLADSESIKGKNNNLAKERDEIQSSFDHLETMYNKLTEVQVQLETIYNSTTVEREQLQSSFDELQITYNNLIEQDDIKRIKRTCGQWDITAFLHCYSISCCSSFVINLSK